MIQTIKNKFEEFKVITMASVKKNISEQELILLREQYCWCNDDREIVICILNDIVVPPICGYADCSNICSFDRNHYRQGCCTDHNKKITNLEKFGTEHNWAKGTSSRIIFE
jgi:hypothetical protein